MKEAMIPNKTACDWTKKACGETLHRNVNGERRTAETMRFHQRIWKSRNEFVLNELSSLKK